MFERMEVSEQGYEEGTSCKTPTSEEANRDGHVRKWKGGEAASPTIPEKGRAGKRKTKSAGHTSDALTGAKKTCLLHEPRHS